MKFRYLFSCILLLVGVINMDATTFNNSKLLATAEKKNQEVLVENDDIASFFAETPVIVWAEAAANFQRLGTAERMSNVFQKIIDAGITGIIIDVKGIHGLVNYDSKIANQLKEWDGNTQALDFDYLKNAILEGKKKGLKVFVSISTFAEGLEHNGVKLGKVFNDPEFEAIQSCVATETGEIKRITDVYSYGLINPLHPKSQEYELSLIKEIVVNYDIDGFVLDYCRYYEICADFSEYSLSKFKEWANLQNLAITDIVQEWEMNTNGIPYPKIPGLNIENGWNLEHSPYENL